MGGGVGGTSRRSTSEGSIASSTVIETKCSGVTAFSGRTPDVIPQPEVQSLPYWSLSGQLGQPGQSFIPPSSGIAMTADASALAAESMPAIIGPLAHATPTP